jgi:O-antigen ligase
MVILTILFFILFIIVFPMGELVNIYLTKSINFSPLELTVLLIFLFWIFLKKKKKLRKDLFTPIFIFVGVMIISLVVNIPGVPPNMLLAASLYLVRWLLYLTIFIVLLNSSENIRKIVPYFMIVGGAMITVVGYFQYFLFPSLQPLYKYGWDEHLYRLFSTFLDPNFCGIILALTFVLNFLLYPRLRRKKIKSLFILYQLITFVAIILTYSRTGIITLLFSSFAFLFLLNKKKIAFGFLAIIMLSVYLIPIISAAISVKTFKIENTNFLRMTSVNARLKAMDEGLKLYYKYPILGVGFNNLRYAQYQNKIIGGSDWESTHAGGGTDNSFLFVADTTGTIGFFAYLFLIYSISKKLFDIRRKQNLMANITIASFIGLVVGSFFINALFYPFIMLWMWSLLGVTRNT